MEPNQYFEVNLNFISSREYQNQPEEIYKMEYEIIVTRLLSNEGLYLFEEDIIERYNNLSLSEILEQNANYVQSMNRRNPKKQDKLCHTYLDTWMSLTIEPSNTFYPHFFALLLKHTDLLKLDHCLTYQLEKYHANNFTSFSRLLALLIRKYDGNIISEKKAFTIQEWIATKDQREKSALETIGSGKKPGRINRRAEDNITTLNREQTILLIQYLKETGVFLRDEYLTDADAGKAFELLTGYSQNTLRQDLGKFYQFQNKENLKKLHQTFSQLIHQIETQMK